MVFRNPGDSGGIWYLNLGDVGSECCFVGLKFGDVGPGYLQGREGCLMIGLGGEWYLNFGEVGPGEGPLAVGDVFIGGDVWSGFGMKMTLAKLSSESTLVSLWRELSLDESLPSSFECRRSPSITIPLPLRSSFPRGGGVGGGRD